MFLYRNIYIIKNDNDIYGVAVLSDNKTVPMPLETYFQRFKEMDVEILQYFPTIHARYLNKIYREDEKMEDGLESLEMLVIDLPHRGKGLGKHLLKEILSLPRYDSHVLVVLENNEPAKHLYRKCGFKEIENLTGYPDEHVKTILMKREKESKN